MNTITLSDTPQNRYVKQVFDHLAANCRDRQFGYEDIPGAYGDKSGVLVELKRLGLRESVALRTFQLTAKAKTTKIELV